MNKLKVFFISLLLIIMTLIIVFLSTVLYSASSKRKIEPFIFQPSFLSVNRIETPININSIPEDVLLNKLIYNFIIEYFYVIPSKENIEERILKSSVISSMTSKQVFNNWVNTEAKLIEEMIKNNKYRTVSITDKIEKRGEFFEVYFELKTWEESNNLLYKPKIEKGHFLIKVVFEKGLRELRGGKKFDVNEYLDSGGNPASVFKFQVKELHRY